MIRCTVRSAGQQADVEVAAHESIQALLAAARARFEIQFASTTLPMTEELGLYSHRLNKDLDPNELLKDLVETGDVLDMRSTRRGGIVGQSSVIPNGLSSSRRHVSLRAKLSVRHGGLHHGGLSSRRVLLQANGGVDVAPGLPGCRLGVFVLAPIKAENVLPPSRFRPLRVSLTCQLLPYLEVQTAPPATGAEYSWSTSMRFNHSDPTGSGLVFAINVYDDPPLGSRVLVGRAYVSLEEALDTPGVSAVRWVRVDHVASDTDDAQCTLMTNGRILVSVCFHPKVSKGPTVHQYIHALAHAEADHPKRERDVKESKTRTFLNSIFGGAARRKKEIVSIQAAVTQRQNSLRRNKGTVSFCVRGIHLCGAQCSKIDGHSSLSLPEFAPIAVIRFDDVENEIHLHPAECDAFIFDHEWLVYSSFSKIELEIYRRATLGTGSDPRRLKSDGSNAVKVCGLTLSCFDVQERVAASWTLDAPVAIRGPGKNAPQRGFLWYPLMIDDEEVGIAQIAAHYSEDLVAILDTEISVDLAYVAPDERTFDPAIVQRNFERLDELYTLVKEISGYWDETLDWKVPIRTILAWTSINTCFFCVPPGHFPLILLLFLLGVLSASFASYLRGHTHKKWIEQRPVATRLKMFRPMASLRVAPLRASHLRSVDGPEHYPDSFVRLFYEPNFKKIPVHQFAQTECVRQSKNPEWTRPQRDSSNNREAFVRANNSRFRDVLRNLSLHSQSAVFHDVVEAWTSKDGSVDANAFRFSMLQPVQMDPSSGENILIDWPSSPGIIRFDVVQDSDPSVLIGRVRLPVRSLVTHERTGGAQEEFVLTLPLALPPRHAVSPSHSAEPHHRETATLTVRIQLTLRNPTDRVTLTETVASEALYDATELEVERELSWVEKYHKAKDVAKNIQQALGTICSTIERFKNLFLWVHPLKTLLVFAAAIVGSVCFYFVPMKYFVLYATMKAFTRRFHKIVDLDLVRIQNLLITIPTDLDLKRMYHWKNQEFLRAKEHTETQAKLQALWSGNVLCQRFMWLQKWQERYCAVRGGRLEIWHSMADTKAGLPPRQSIPIASTVDTCSEAEAADTPKDCYPLVVLDMSKSLVVLSSRARRKIICLKSEDDLRGFADAVRATGEPLLSTPPGSLPANE